MKLLRTAWKAIRHRITRPRRPSACTRVASVYELLEMIFGIVQRDHGNGGLVSVLVASKFLSHVALDILWRTQEDIIPLFLTLRPCVYVRDDNTIRLSDKSINKQSDGFIREDVWNRFQNYARRIKILDISAFLRTPLRLHESVLKALVYRGTLLRDLYT
ncbi:hypothetical protein HDZ31DRAFT_78756, partial [Schizophyllum fasciatum]